MSQTGPCIGRGGASLLVAILVQSSKSLSPILESDHQILAIQTKTAPVLHHSQPFTSTVQVGVDQPSHTRVETGVTSHGFHGSLWRMAFPPVMENSGSDGAMRVLIWGIVLLGGIGVLIVWGLSNAYPTPV